MSRAANYINFCKKYELNPQLENSKEQYQAYSNNLDMFNGVIAENVTTSAIKKAQQPNWGGKREGAGRKAEKGKTIVKRVPEKYWDTLSEVIEFLDEKEGKYDLEHIKSTIMIVLRNNY